MASIFYLFNFFSFIASMNIQAFLMCGLSAKSYIKTLFISVVEPELGDETFTGSQSQSW